MEERWKDIPGFEGRYAASTKGNIKNLKSGKIISSTKRIKNVCILYDKNGKRKTYAKHRLIALTFLGEPPENTVVLHGEKGRLDNSITNLSYGTVKQNNTVDYERDNPGFPCVGCKLNKSQVRVIKYLLRTKKFEHKNIAEIFSVTRRTINYIANNKTWKTV